MDSVIRTVWIVSAIAAIVGVFALVFTGGSVMEVIAWLIACMVMGAGIMQTIRHGGPVMD